MSVTLFLPAFCHRLLHCCAPFTARLVVYRLGCPHNLKDIVTFTKHGSSKGMQGKVVGLPTIADAIGFGNQKKNKAWVRWEGGDSSWEWWSDLRSLRRSPVRAKRMTDGSYRPGHEPTSSKRQHYSQPTLSGKQVSWSRSFPGSSVRAAPGAEDMLTPGDRLSTGRLRHS